MGEIWTCRSRMVFRQKLLIWFLLIIITASLVIMAFIPRPKTESTDVRETDYSKSEILVDQSDEPNATLEVVNQPLPRGACSTYNELRNINFLHQAMKDRICKGASAYTITDSAFPLCELQQQLPQSLTGPVKSGSFLTYIRSPITNRNVSCFVYKGSDYISNFIRHAHIFEESNVRMMQKLLTTMIAQWPVTFVDIGANIGMFTLTALDIGVPVVALDANIRNLMRVQLSAESSGVSHKLRLFWNFVSSQVSLMYLNFPPDCNVGGATKLGRAVTDTIPVMSTTADSIAKAIGTRTVVLKVDIEGGEAAFFQSARGLFTKFDVPVVHMEWLQRHMTKHERERLLRFFFSRRYSPRSMNDLNRRINIEDPGINCEDLVWIREDFIEQRKIPGVV